jgi:hypothetical protein
MILIAVMKKKKWTKMEYLKKIANFNLLNSKLHYQLKTKPLLKDFKTK